MYGKMCLPCKAGEGDSAMDQAMILSPKMTQVINEVSQLSAEERLMLAKLLLDSLVEHGEQDEADWLALGLATFQQDWDNPDDAIYDDWREHYGVSEG